MVEMLVSLTLPKITKVSRLRQKTESGQFSIFGKWSIFMFKLIIINWFTWSCIVGLIYLYAR